MLEIVDILLFYVSQGAEFIRLDAIAYLWKEIGTSCIHLPKTHTIVKLFRAILDKMSPNVKLVTETNVPHAENISYFGNGFDEAQLIYNFALPPLVLHTFLSGNVAALSNWASGIKFPSKAVTFLNFLASHDGIGLNAVKGLLSNSEIEDLVAHAKSHGGLISRKTNSDGEQSPYELNENYFDTLEYPNTSETPNVKVDRFLSAHTILLAFIGVPAIYFHSMFGSARMARWGNSIRSKSQYQSPEAGSRQAAIGACRRQFIAGATSRDYRIYCNCRVAEPAFSPGAGQRVLDCGSHVFAVLRTGPDKPVLCLSNVSRGATGN